MRIERVLRVVLIRNTALRIRIVQTTRWWARGLPSIVSPRAGAADRRSCYD